MAIYVDLTAEEVDSPEFVKLRPSELKVYLVCRRYADWTTAEVSMSDRIIGLRVGMGRRGARRVILQLIKKKLLEGRRGMGRQFSAYLVRDMRGEFLFTPAVNKNGSQGGTEMTLRGEQKGKQNKYQYYKSQINENIERRNGTEPPSPGEHESPLGESGDAVGAGERGQVITLLRNAGVKGRVPTDLSERVSLKMAKRGIAIATTKAKKHGWEISGKEFSGYLINTLNGIWGDGVKALAPPNPNATKSSQQDSAIRQPPMSDGHGVGRAASDATTGVCRGRNSEKPPIPAEVAELHAIMERGKDASSRATRMPTRRIL